jgi:hypothetical protein
MQKFGLKFKYNFIDIRDYREISISKVFQHGFFVFHV